ncbi:MAG: hypothetical protein LBO05_13130 [Deltaproteobacteria bacterium]|nr:hypothetical protein [Deltaproteobacteria bacterium]
MSKHHRFTTAAVLLAALMAAAALAATPAAAQNSFQFNELDFDRQGSGQGPESSQTGGAGMLAIPGEQAQQDNLTGLFSDGPAAPQGERIQNLPGEPSPVARPAGQGEARIELAGGSGRSSSRPAARSSGTVPPSRTYAMITTIPAGDEFVQVLDPTRRRRGGGAPTLPRNPRRTEYVLMVDADRQIGEKKPVLPREQVTQVRRYVNAMNDWRARPEAAPAGCVSYLPDRPLYHVRCLGALARRD